ADHARGAITPEEVRARIMSWIGHARQADTWRLREGLLAERAAFCWLTFYENERDYAESGRVTLEQANYHQSRINAAHRRFLSALKAPASVRKPGLPALPVNIAERR